MHAFTHTWMQWGWHLTSSDVKCFRAVDINHLYSIFQNMKGGHWWWINDKREVSGCAGTPDAWQPAVKCWPCCWENFHPCVFHREVQTWLLEKPSSVPSSWCETLFPGALRRSVRDTPLNNTLGIGGKRIYSYEQCTHSCTNICMPSWTNKSKLRKMNRSLHIMKS